MGRGDFGQDGFFASPLRGEADAHAAGEGFSAAIGTEFIATAEPLIPALSLQGRGGGGPAALVELETSDGHA